MRSSLKQISITTIGTVINAMLGAVFYVFLANNLGVIEYGIFTTTIAFLTVLSDIGSVGTDTGLVRFVGQYIKEDTNKAYRFLKLALIVKLVVWGVIFAGGFFLAKFVTSSLLGRPLLYEPFLMAFVGVGGTLLYSFATSALQSLEKFKSWVILNVSLNGLRLLFIFLLSLAGSIALYSSLAVYIVLPFIGFLIALCFLPNFLRVKDFKDVSKQFFKYNFWVALVVLMASLTSRLDIFLTTKYLSLSQLGVYSVATSLSSIASQAVLAIAVVVAPKLASFKTQKEAKKYLIRLQVLAFFLSILAIIIGFLIAYLVVVYFYGVEYRESLVPLWILIVAQSLFLLSIPAHTSIFYFFSRPQVFFTFSITHFLIVFVTGGYLIPTYGIIGAAITVLVGNFYNFLAPTVWVVLKFKREAKV